MKIEFDIPAITRTLEPDELRRLVDVIGDTFATFEWERTQPVHLCRRKQHGTQGYRHSAICLQGCLLGDLSGATPEAATAAAKQAAREHQLKRAHEITFTSSPEGPLWLDMPRCHDCGRELVHPPGMSEGWVCPAVHRHSRAEGLTADQVLECGGAR